MTLLLTMLPIYLAGNLHCLGMCGPLVMMIGHHRHRYFYFFGRIVSFSIVGALSGEAGGLLQFGFNFIHLSAYVSFLFASFIFLIGVFTLAAWRVPLYSGLSGFFQEMEKKITLLILRDKPLATFLFGAFTVGLPCGQSLLVFAACALTGSFSVGLINGFAFALLTSPSLWIAMRAQGILKIAKKHYSKIMGSLAIVISALAFCRGLAELGLISHLVLNDRFHIVLY